MTRFAEMRKRLWFLLGALVVYRMGTFIPVPGIDAARFAAADAARGELLQLAIDLGGSISGEHGLGLVKSGRLAQQWNPAAVAAHAAIKRALDPKGLFNPGKKLGVWLQPDPPA